MADDSDSPLSSLSSIATDDELEREIMSAPTTTTPTAKKKGLHKYFKTATGPREPTPEPPKREPSPPHEYVLADNDAIAFIVMFRSRFADAFPRSLPHYGPQDVERGVSSTEGERAGEEAERLLCALLGLCLNRKKEVERGHYGRALEDAISQFQTQWPVEWGGQNPLRGGKTFNSMTAVERLVMLKALVFWCLNASEAVQGMIKESYKQTRRDDDKNQPRSVQPWFSDSYRRRYWLVEGLEDSYFRVYRENDGKTRKSNAWFSVAGSIGDVQAMADKFMEEGTANAKTNAEKLRSAVPRFEQGEEKRRRREYRLARKAAFERPEPGFGMYEGRTRGKRMRYTYDEGEEEDSGWDSTTRRSTRQGTPNDGPTITASGRQVKPRQVGAYGESLVGDQRIDVSSLGEGEEESDNMPTTTPSGRPRRAAMAGRPASRTREVYREDVGSDSDEAQSSGNGWSGDENEPDAESEPDFDADEEEEDDEEMSDEGLEADEIDLENAETQESLIVQLRYRKGKTPVPEQARPQPPQTAYNGFYNTFAAPNAVQHKSPQQDTIKVAAPPASEFVAQQEIPVVNGIHQGTPMVNGVNNVSPTSGLPNGVPQYPQQQQHPQYPQPHLQTMDVS